MLEPKLKDKNGMRKTPNMNRRILVTTLIGIDRNASTVLVKVRGGFISAL